MSSLRFTRFLRVSLSLSLFISSTQISFADSPSIWKERKPAGPSSEPLLLASLPPAFRLPAPGVSHNFKSTSQMVPSRSPHLKSRDLLTISSRKGTVRRVFSPAGPSKGTIVLLQDVHGHSEAQENLAGMIQDLTASDRLSKIGLEGMAGHRDLGRFHQFNDRQALQFSVEFLVARGDLSGPAAAGLLDERLHLFGLERLSLYQKNIDAYKDSMGAFPLLREELRSWQEAWSEKKERLRNPRLESLLMAAERFQSDDLSLSAYIKRLSMHTPTTLAMEAFQEALALEESLDFSWVEKERTSLLKVLIGRLSRAQLESLSRAAAAAQTGLSSQAAFYQALAALCRSNGLPLSQFPEMDRYISYLLLAESIDMEKIYSDVRRMERDAFLSAAKTEEEKALAAEQRHLFLAGKLLSFSLTPPEWTEVKNIEHILTEKFSAPASHFSFYRTAEERNAALADNLIHSMGKETLGAMVVGGFHAEAIGKYLQDKNFTVLSVVPRLSTIEAAGEPSALGVFLQEKTPLEKIFRNEKITLAPDPLLLTRLPFAVAATQAFNGTAAAPHRTIGALYDPKETAPETDIEVGENSVRETFINPDSPSKTIGLNFSFTDEGKPVDLDEEEFTSSLTASLFRKSHPWVNRSIRLAASGGIVVHELGHLFFVPSMIRRADFGFKTIAKGLLSGFPWETRGPPALAGLMANGLTAGTLGILTGTGFFAPALTLSGSGFLTFLLISNTFVLSSELILTPFASQLNLAPLSDIKGWALGRRYIPAEKLLKSAAEEAGFSDREVEKIFQPQRVVRNFLPLVRDSGEKASYLSYRVQHNNNAGPFKGGLRFHPKLSLSMIYKLALEMSVKTSLGQLPLGGGKGGVRIDSDLHSLEELARVTRALVRALFDAGAIGPGLDIPAPDIGTNAALMAVFMDEYARQRFQHRYHRLPNGHPLSRFIFPKDKRKNAWFMAESDLSYPGRGLETPFVDQLDVLLPSVDAGKIRAVITGKPPSLGGLPSREAGTGDGVAIAATRAAHRYGLVKNPTEEKPLNGVKIAIQGFGNVGYFAALNLQERGAVIVAVGERDGTVYNPNGIDVKALLAHRKDHKDENGILQSEGFDLDGSVATKDPGVEAMFVDADMIIPAAMEEQITADNAGRVKAKIIVEGANGPVTDEADEFLEEAGKIIVPDVFANAGGVTVSYYEWLHNLGALKDDEGNILDPNDVDAIQEKLDRHMSSVFKKIADLAEEKNLTLRQAAGRLVIKSLSRKPGFKLPSANSDPSELNLFSEEEPNLPPAEIFAGILRQLQAEQPLDRAQLFGDVMSLLDTAPASLDIRQESEFPGGVRGRIQALESLTRAVTENKNQFGSDLSEKLNGEELNLNPWAVRRLVERWIRFELDRPLESALIPGKAQEEEVTLAAIRGNLGEKQINRIIQASLNYHDAEKEKKGRLVFIADSPSTEVLIRSAAGPEAEILTVEGAFGSNAYGLRELVLNRIESALNQKGLFQINGRLQIISPDRPSLTGLTPASPFLEAVVIQIDELLRSIEIPIADLDALNKFERILMIQA